ncbi:MAG: DUF4058 family protein [Planctomycetales bacterium]|nr:DUF4058 family protein [Planctomycetales bacterium]
MKSPFPGMDPYLEQFWGDIHARLMVYMADAIMEQLPGDLQARVESRLLVDADEYRRHVYPDVLVSEPVDKVPVPTTSSSDIALAETHVVALSDEPPVHRHIEIIDSNSGNRVVTVIEVLSPTNKRPGPARESYQRKQHEYLRAGVNLVEIDLIREGKFIVAVPREMIPLRLRSPYIICIRRSNRPLQAEYIPVRLQEPLPNIAIPLRPTDTDVPLLLQPLLDQCYKQGRYGTIDYQSKLEAYFSDDDRQWINELLGRQ